MVRVSVSNGHIPRGGWGNVLSKSFGGSGYNANVLEHMATDMISLCVCGNK